MAYITFKTYTLSPRKSIPDKKVFSIEARYIGAIISLGLYIFLLLKKYHFPVAIVNLCYELFAL